MTAPEPKALLFDLGGVLVDIDFGLALRTWSVWSALPAAELERAFVMDGPYERHERGEISAGEYFAELQSKLQLSATREQIESGWNAIFVGEIEETRVLVEKVAQRLPCYAFTNTNASHMKCWSALYPRVALAFKRIFASHQMGLRKPERSAFEHICRTLALAPDEILFFDDSVANIEGARAVGLQGVLVRTPKDVVDALRQAALL